MHVLASSAVSLRKIIEELMVKNSEGAHMPALVEAFDHLLGSLSDLKLNEDDCKNGPGVVGYVLIGSEWYPCSVMNKTKSGWVEWRADGPEGQPVVDNAALFVASPDVLLSLVNLEAFVTELCAAGEERATRLLELEWKNGNRLFAARAAIEKAGAKLNR